ncbi:hypothetical protein [Shewanella sp. MBTL60-007]|uniref:hypothetical protein n=1 Tax=Shewanella sp. MBTL60-007 TaxID=2815911 RepID=UPI001BC6D018|nr:hypothetical protein [Shewanella sp. MBTL60-007]GIU20949.1 hypothetical protein TUM3792_21220 [Shewanella sp. MBTL60-007]
MGVTKQLCAINLCVFMAACSSTGSGPANTHFIDPTPVDMQVVKTPVMSVQSKPVDANFDLKNVAPTRYEHYSNVLLPQEFSFLNPMGAFNSRLQINETNGKIRFLVKRDTLRSNIDALLSFTTAKTVYSDISDKHFMPNNFWIESDTMLGLVDEMIKPYTSPKRLIGRAWPNDIVTVGYRR